MLRKQIVFSFIIIFLINYYAFAGWPEDGWIGVADLDLSYHGTRIRLTNSQRDLAKEEKRISNILPSNDTTNLVLAKFAFIGDGPANFQSHFVLGPNQKIFAFESGWESILSQDPSAEAAQKIIRPYAAQVLKTEGLSLVQQQKLVENMGQVVAIGEYYQTQIVPNFEFNDERMPPSDILQCSHQRLESVVQDGASYVVLQKLEKDTEAYRRLERKNEDEQKKVATKVEQMSSEITSSVRITSEVLKEFGRNIKLFQDSFAAQERELQNIGSKVVATYWHSEQKFLKYFEESMQQILSQPVFQNLGFIPRVIVLQLHSRFDICSFCSHVLARALTQPEGILEQLRQATVRKFGLDSQTPLYLTTSFREERESAKDHFIVEQDALNGFEDLDQMKQKPAFPLMHIPNPSGS